MSGVTGIVFDIQEFTLHDGPGIRVTVFLKGCPLRCLWCHNPEGLSARPQLLINPAGCDGCGLCLRGCTHPACAPFARCARACPQNLLHVCGTEHDAQTLAARLQRYRAFLERSGGGITLSGGEPLMQPEFTLALLRALKPLHTAVQTSGHAAPEVFAQVADAADLVMLDIKHVDPDAHRAATGVENDLILRNLAALMTSEKPFIARVPVIPGINDDDAALTGIARLLRGAGSLSHVELLPYNPLASAKYAKSGRKYHYREAAMRDMRGVEALFAAEGIATKVYGIQDQKQ